MAHPEVIYGGASAFPTNKLINYFEVLHAQHKLRLLDNTKKM